jgi:hypothetical protein
MPRTRLCDVGWDVRRDPDLREKKGAPLGCLATKETFMKIKREEISRLATGLSCVGEGERIREDCIASRPKTVVESTRSINCADEVQFPSQSDVVAVSIASNA